MTALLQLSRAIDRMSEFIGRWVAWLVLFAALLSVVSLFYYLRVARAIYVEPPSDLSPIVVGRTTLLAILLAVIGVVGLGVVPGPVWIWAQNGGAALDVGLAGP